MTLPFNAVTLIDGGECLRPVETTLRDHPWWAVYVVGTHDAFGCVYGGRAGRVPALVREHERNFGKVTRVVAFPFAEAAQSAVAVPVIESFFSKRKAA